MSILYKDLGADKRISEIVFAGSHDASITSGSSHAQTQTMNIGLQAASGVRLFDLRILARKNKDGSAKLVGYHGSSGGKGTGSFVNKSTGTSHQVQTNSKMTAGEFGLGLSSMLEQAKDFVEATGEFLIFKFDKCTNYSVIAEFCIDILKGNIYKPIGIEFGKLTLDDLSKKVVCVFNDDELAEMTPYTTADGILGFRSLKGKTGVKPYIADYPGLQYYGKGGTSPLKFYQTQNMKMKDNEGIQKRAALQMAAHADDTAPDVLGMMYWTSTGSMSSIRKRNENVMWGATGVTRMGELWRQGLEASVATQLAKDEIKYREQNGVRKIKAYFPNIIMIDFADPGKCRTIYELNTAVDQRLAAAYQQYSAA